MSKMWFKMSLRKRSETARKSFGFWYLPWQQLMMAWSEVVLSEKLLLVFRCFTNKMVLFGFAKSKAINFRFKDYFDRSIFNFQRLARQKTIQIRSSNKFKSSLQHAGTRFNSKKNRFTQVSLSKVCSMYWQKYKAQIVELCSFNNFKFNYWPLNIQKDSNLLCRTAKPNFKSLHLTFVFKNFKNKTWVGECFRSLPNRHN